MPKKSTEGEHDFQAVIRDARQHLIGVIDTFPVENLTRWSNMRRAGVDGIKQWKERFNNVGFNLAEEEGHSIRAFPSKEDLPKWLSLFKDLKEGLKRLGKDDIPEDMKALLLKIIDGQHRCLALHAKLKEGRELKEDEIYLDKYKYVRVLLYHPDIVPHAITLSKAANEVSYPPVFCF